MSSTMLKMLVSTSCNEILYAFTFRPLQKNLRFSSSQSREQETSTLRVGGERFWQYFPPTNEEYQKNMRSPYYKKWYCFIHSLFFHLDGFEEQVGYSLLQIRESKFGRVVCVWQDVFDVKVAVASREREHGGQDMDGGASQLFVQKLRGQNGLKRWQQSRHHGQGSVQIRQVNVFAVDQDLAQHLRHLVLEEKTILR